MIKIGEVLTEFRMSTGKSIDERIERSKIEHPIQFNSPHTLLISKVLNASLSCPLNS